ncbi:ABC transporter substrate-binding protein [Natronorubrum aibiense]|uniref:Extracellular solute-binding protein n=1 Tax=Natronorubrum aibiense TaxID=348826 RepID=A0A5P9P9U6_9EURY|nr:ABC transporter substrate-binding protein [Natronorubrum aibiense]QFU84777.1 extracellular solute-binding protein [Natronorubrum aibiense]
MVRKHWNGQGADRRTFLKSVATTGAVASFAGCLGGGQGGDGSTIEFWTLFAGGDGDAMEAMVDAFNDEHDDFQISRERQPFEQYYDSLFTSMTGGTPPDLAVFHTNELQRFVDTLTPLDDRIESETESAYVESIWNETALDGSHVALPLDTHPNALYYNKDIFEEAGLDPDSPPTNFEELQHAADEITANTDAQAFNPEPYGQFYSRQFAAWLKSVGSDFLNEDATAAAFDNDEALELVEFYADIADAYGWDEPDASNDRGNRAFRAGDLAMTIDGTWFYGVLREAEYDWGMTKPFVAPGATEQYTWANSHALAVPANNSRSDELTEAAVRAAEWLTQNSAEWGTVAGHMPASNDVLDSGELQNADVWDATLSTFFEMADNDQLVYLPSTDNNDDYVRPVDQTLAQVYSQQLEPADALEEMVSTVNDNLS